MIVKIIRNEPDPVRSDIYEVESLEFCNITFTVNKDKPAQENLILYKDMENSQSVLLYENDEVFLCNENGKTVDRWLI